MKIINLGRQQGKTTRLLYASEFQDIPILCTNYAQKHDLELRAKRLGLHIPEPICVNEITYRVRSSEIANNGLLIDEAPMVLAALLSHFGIRSGIKAMTLTSDELQDKEKQNDIKTDLLSF